MAAPSSGLPLRLLMVEDRSTDAELIVDQLRQSGFELGWKRVDTEPDYVAALDLAPDVIISDHRMPRFDSMRAQPFAGARAGYSFYPGFRNNRRRDCGCRHEARGS